MFVKEDMLLGPWNEIKCVAQPALSQAPAQTAPVGSSGGIAVVGGVPAAGTVQAKISSAANSYQGVSTAAGPSGGSKACAWAVNNNLTNAGVPTLDGDSVPGMEVSLKGGRGTQINQSSAGPGDIVIEAGGGHVGICQNVGCTQVISNSSSKASFSWVSGPDFAPSYSNGPGRFYHLGG